MNGSISTLHKPYILYADDDDDDLMFVADTFRKIIPHVYIQTYSNGREAFEFLKLVSPTDHLPSLILLDYNMPGWDGLRTLKSIKENKLYAHIPVFIFTISDFYRHRELSLAEGATDYFMKPYNWQGMEKVCAVFASYLYKA